jgi:predicted secreted protein
MNLNRKKMVAPIFVTVIMVLYYVVYFGLLITLQWLPKGSAAA